MSTPQHRTLQKIRTFATDVSHVRGPQATPKPTQSTPPQITATQPDQPVPAVPTFAVTKTLASSTATSSISTVSQPVTSPLQVSESVVPQPPTTPAITLRAAVSQFSSDTTRKGTPPSTPAPVMSVSQQQQILRNIPAITGASLVATTLDDPLGEIGTMVSSKRTKRFRLLPAIGKAVAGWTQETKEQLTHKEEEETIRSAESRIETLKAAAQASYHAPQDDHGFIVKQIIKSERPKIGLTSNIKPAKKVAAPTWKHTSTTDSFVKLENANPIADDVPTLESTPKVAAIPVRQIPITATPTETVTHWKSGAHIIPEATTTTDTEVRTEPSAWSHTTPNINTLTEDTPNTDHAVTPEEETEETTSWRSNETTLEETEVEQTPLPSPIYQTPATPVLATRSTLTETNTTNTLLRQNGSTLILAGIVLIALTLGTGFTFYIFNTQKNSTVTEEAQGNTAPLLIVNAPIVSIPAAGSHEDILSNLQQVTLSTTETQQIVLTSDIQTILTPTELTIALDLHTTGSFTRSLKSFVFGSHNGTAPLIIIESTDFNTAFAGMLSWETSMSADLAPLFGTPVTESFDPTARTTDQIRTAFFRDTITGNVSTRLLVDSNNTDRLIYGFIKPNLILITTNQNTFELMAPLIQNSY